MDIYAKVKGIKYNPLLCRDLQIFDFGNLEEALSTCGSFILELNKTNKVALSWWVSAKRTRSYPYARVYDTLGFSGKKITIIPIFKDEGKEGDRDFLQWDTISLMSLLGIYVIVAYYNDAKRSTKYRQKITNQRFDIEYIKKQIKNLLSYQSDALHWNLEQIDKIGQIGNTALEAYINISKKLDIEMHSIKGAEKRIADLLKGKDEFMKLSRTLAEKAQRRESATIQPKEFLSGTKATITIQNYLGGNYYFTSDETEISNNSLFLIEGKHSEKKAFPSLEDIKDGLIKMVLFTNLEYVKIDDKNYDSVAVLKLSVKGQFNVNNLNQKQKEIVELLKKEAKINNFLLRII